MKNILNAVVTLCLITLSAVALFPQPIHADTTPAFTLEFGPTETVYDWSTQKCVDFDIPDDPPNALVDSAGNVQLYSSEFIARKFIGNNLSDVKHDCAIIWSGDHQSPDPTTFNTYEWLASPYTLDGTTIYSLVHNEYHGDSYHNCNSTTAHSSLDCWFNSINLAKSTDGGKTFTQSTPPTQNVAHLASGFDPNNTQYNVGAFHPSNIIQQDGYYYATARIGIPGLGQPDCLMRTNNLDDPASWYFWNGTNFGSPARSLSATNSCAGIAYGDFNLQKSTYLQGFTVATSVVTNGVPQVGIDFSSSLTSWPSPLATQWFTRPGHPLSVYNALIQPGAETRNFEDIGRSPWLYYVACGDENANCTAFLDDNRDIKRVRVRFNKPEDVGKYDVIDLHFNEYKGTKTLDSSFYGNDGTLSGNVNFKQEGDTKFIHISDTGYVKVNPNESLNLTDKMTISLRLRTTQNPAANTFPSFMEKQGDNKRHFGLYLLNGGKLHLSLMNGANFTGSVSTHAVNDGAWHDIQINVDSAAGTTTYVIDGVLDSTQTTGGKLSDGVNTAQLTIGGYGLVGDLDHVTIYNYLLPTPSVKPGDLNNDGKVDIFDYNQLISNFGHPYTIFDYNTLVANYGPPAGEAGK